MRIVHPHQLSQTETRNRINQLLASIQSSFNDQLSDFTYTWNAEHTRLEYSFKIRGQLITGKVACDPLTVIFDAELPFAVRLFQNQIENMIREKMKAAFG